MNAQWKKFNASDEQISEILNAKDGVKLKYTDGRESPILVFDRSQNIKILNDVTAYMDCQPHPHADMIIEWARTGREVYFLLEKKWILCLHPEWLHDVKYSFNPDGDGK